MSSAQGLISDEDGLCHKMPNLCRSVEPTRQRSRSIWRNGTLVELFLNYVFDDLCRGLLYRAVPFLAYFLVI